MSNTKQVILTASVSLLLLVSTAAGQTTSFTYQGKLADSGNPANGSFDFQFKLFDTATVGTGTQQGTPQTLTNVTISGGIFTVTIDFGVCPTCFDGSARFLEIAVKPTSGGTFTTLGPRQPITSTPYALKSLNAATADGLSVTCVNCITSSQIQSVSGSAVTGTIPVASVPAGSSNYIQNSTTQQVNSNFNISGNGIVGGNGIIGGTLSVGNNGTSARLFLNRASPIGANSADINFFSAGSPDFSLGTSQGSAAPSDFSIYNYGISNNVFTILKANGNVGIGTTVPIAKLHVAAGGIHTGVRVESTDATAVWASSSGARGVIGTSTTNTGVSGFSTSGWGVTGESVDGYGVRGDSTNNWGVVGVSINSYAGFFDGNVYVTGTVTQNSDARLKQGVSKLGYGLAEVLRLRPVSWLWKDRPDRGTQLGLVAQEVELVLPELVSTAKDAEQTKGVNYVGLVPVLVNAIQEQQRRLDQQQVNISKQHAEIETLLRELRQVKQQEEIIQQQQQEMAAIKQLLCAAQPQPDLCKAKSVK